MDGETVILRKPAFLLSSIFLVVILGKVFFLLEAWHSPLFHIPVVDAKVYCDLARMIAGGEGYAYPVFATNPFYPYFLGLFFSLFDDPLLPVVIFQMFVGLGSLILLYRIGKRLGGSAVAIVALVLAGFYKPLLFYEIFLLPTTIGVSINLALIALFMSFAERRTPGLAFASGLLLGFGTLAQGNLLLILPLLLLWIVYLQRGRKLFISAGLLVVGFLLPLLPVTWRNWDRGGDRVLVSSHGGVNFYMGNNEKAAGMFSFPEDVVLTPENINVHASKQIAENVLGRSLKPSEVSSYWFGRGLAWIGDHPGDWFKLLGKKAFLFLNAYEIPDNADLYFHSEGNRALRWLPFTFGLIGPLGLAGLIALAAKRKGGVIGLFLLAQIMSALIFYTHSRYRIPFAVVLIPVAAFGLVTIVQGFRRWKVVHKAGIVVALGLLFLLINIDPVRGGGGRARAFSLTHLANGLAEMGELSEAEKTYQEALQLLPDHGSALYGLGLLRHGQERFPDAVEMYRRAIRAVPAFAEAHLNLGVSLRALNQDHEAEGEFREALQIRPEWATARYNLGNVLYDLGRFGEAVEQYGYAIELDPGNSLCIRNLSNACEASGDLEGAEEAVRNGLAAVGEDADLRNRLGGILEEQGLVDEALIEYRRAVSINPRHSAAICNIGLVQSHRGEYQSAIITWRTILEYDPGSPIIRNIEMAEAALRDREGSGKR